MPNVVRDTLKVTVISNVAIEVILLPKASAKREVPLNLFARKAFAGVNDTFKSDPRCGSQKHMNVVRHDHPIMENEETLVMVAKVFLNDESIRRDS